MMFENNIYCNVLRIIKKKELKIEESQEVYIPNP